MTEPKPTTERAAPPRTAVHGDDSQMSRFEAPGVRHVSARQAVLSMLVTAALLLVLAGDSVRSAAAELSPGIGRDIISAVGDGTGWVADRVGLSGDVDDVLGGLSPDDELGSGGFDAAPPPPGSGERDAEISDARPLDTLLVTGDSLSTPLDLELARGYAGGEVEVVRDPHLATAISNEALVDWAALAEGQVNREQPDAVVVFIGANEGYPMPATDGAGQVQCCGAAWRAVFAARAGRMMDTYAQGGEAHVYWLNVMTPRDPDRREIADAVNEAIATAAEARERVEIVDVDAVFSPEGTYTDAIEVDGASAIVRESDGIHLNAAGSALAAELVLAAISADYGD